MTTTGEELSRPRCTAAASDDDRDDADNHVISDDAGC